MGGFFKNIGAEPNVDINVVKYRNRHRRCEFCKYLHYDNMRGIPGCSGFYDCLAKRKVIYDGLIFNPHSTPRWFCSCYCVDLDKLPK